MEFPVINRHGTFTHVVSGSRYEFVLRAAPEGGSVLMADIPSQPSWWDGMQWHAIPPQPAPHMTWDEMARQWVDMRTQVEKDADLWSRIKLDRDATAEAPLTVLINGMPPLTFDADAGSQREILSAALRAWMAVTSRTPWSITWTLANNTEVELTAEQVIAVFEALTRRTLSARASASSLRPASTRF